MGGRSTPLGVLADSLPRSEARFTLPPGGGFVLYTDGLVERRGEDIEIGIERLVTAIEAHRDPARLVSALLEGGASEDDVCVLVFSRTPR